MKHEQAKAIAVAICYKLQPFCEHIKIAGSIRRKKAEVKDIEICAVFKREKILDLFEVEIGQFIPEACINTVYKLGEVIKGKPDGRMMQIKLPEGIMLDLFLPTAPDFFRQYAIRTGSSDYSFKTIAVAWKKLGWCGTANGLRKISESYKKPSSDGKSHTWYCVNPHPSLPPAWQSEEEFFKWLQIPFINPENRI